MSDPQHIHLMETVAKHFFGEPNGQLSKKGELRFGTHGSKSVDLKKGTWFDHEVGEGGGPLDLIKRETGISEARECYAWAESQGYWRNGGGSQPQPPQLGPIVATYDYVDENGTLLFQVTRHDPKTFRQRRPNGQGGWVWSLNGVRRVVYRLPEATETIANERLITIPEGEKDVDALWRIGVPATCNPMGAGKWSDELTPTFAGADVCLIADNDAPGRKHANEVAAKLVGIAVRVRVLDLARAWPQCPEKGDISDWIAAGGTAEQLYALIEALPSWQPSNDAEDHGFAWTLLMLGEEVTDAMRNWLVDKMLPQAGVGLIAGQWGLFKTFCACDLSAAVMRGGQFIGFPIARPGGVLLLATEGQSEVNVRMSAAWQAHGGNGRPPFVWVNKAPPLLAEHAADILTAMIKHAKAKLQRDHGVGLSLVLIDALGKAAGYAKAGDENDAALAKRISKALNDAALATDVLILGVTHFGKHVETGTRGSSAFEDDADVVLALIGDRTIGGQVSNTRLCLRKLRGGQSGDEFPFQTRGVVVGNENTLVIDWRGSEEPTAAPKAKADAWAKKSLRLLRQALMNTLVDCGKDIRPWADGPTVRAVDLEVVRDQFYKGHPAAEATDAAGKKSARQKAFKRAVEDARASNLIGSWEIEGVTYVWLVAPPTQGEMPV